MRKPARAATLLSALAALILALTGGLAATSGHSSAATRSTSFSDTGTVSPNPLIIGDTATYHLTVTNMGSSTATAVVTTVTITPGNAVTIESLPSGCTAAGQTVTCTTASIAAGASASYDIGFKVNSDLSDGTNLRFEASTKDAAGGTGGTTPGGLIVIAQTRVDVAIEKTGPATVNPDGTITYTIKVTNHGPSDAPQVFVHDATDGNQDTITGLPPECPASGLTVTCNLGTLKAGEVREFTFTVKVKDLPAGTAIPNCATVDVGKPDTDTSNNMSCISTMVGGGSLPIANIDVVKSAPATVEQDGTIHYTVKVTNRGPHAAENVVINDPLDSSYVTAGTLPDGCSLSDTTVTCKADTLDVGETKTYEFTVKLKDGDKPGTNILNCAAATSHNSFLRLLPYSCTQTLIEPPPDADVSIGKTGPATVNPDGTITYSLTVTNHGPADASDVVAEDPMDGLPVTITSVPDGCGTAGKTVTCHLGTLLAGEERILTITAVPDPGTAAGTLIGNCAGVYTATHDPRPANNDSCTQTEIGTGPVKPHATLSVLKTGPARVGEHGVIHYTVTVTNHGPVPAENVILNDPEDYPLDHVVSLPRGCALDGVTVRCKLGTLAVGERKTLEFDAALTDDAKEGTHLENVATADGDNVIDRPPPSVVETAVEGHAKPGKPGRPGKPGKPGKPVVPVTG